MSFPYLRIDAGASAECPQCRKSVLLPGNLQGIASKRRGRVNYRSNLALEISGLFLLFWYPIGSMVGLVLIAIGWSKSRVWRCSNCETIATDAATRCSNCGAAFTSE